MTDRKTKAASRNTLLITKVFIISLFLNACGNFDGYREKLEQTVNGFYKAIQEDRVEEALGYVDKKAFEHSSKDAWMQMINLTQEACGHIKTWEIDTIVSKKMDKEKGYGLYVNVVVKNIYENCTLYEKLYIFVPSGKNAVPAILSYGMSDQRESIHVKPDFL